MLKEYVHNEASEAVITIHLYNGNYNDNDVYYSDQTDQPYSPAYIKIRTVIGKDGRKTLKIESLPGNECKAKNIYIIFVYNLTRKHENFHLVSDEKIMKHFGLNVSNPHVILDQDNCNNFFTNHQPKFLYDFLNYNFENMSLEDRNDHVGIYYREVKRCFREYLWENGMNGELIFRCKERIVEIKKTEVDESSVPQYLYNESISTQVSIADIGEVERCKFLMCFLMSIWQQSQQSPFRAIDDDWNIFLDEHDRKEIVEVLLRWAIRNNRQSFFVFPHDALPNNPDLTELIGNKILIKDVREDNFNNLEHETGDKSVGANCEVTKKPETEVHPKNSKDSSQITNSNSEEQKTNQCQPSTSSTLLFEPMPSTSSQSLNKIYHNIEHVNPRPPLPVDKSDQNLVGPISQISNSKQKKNQCQTSTSSTSFEPAMPSTSSQSLNKICDDIGQMKNLAENLDFAHLKKLLKTNSEKNETETTREIKALNETIENQTKEHSRFIAELQAEVKRSQNELKHMKSVYTNRVSSIHTKLSRSEEQNHELVKENSKLTNQCKDQAIVLDKSQEEIESLKETLGEKKTKLENQKQMTETLQTQMNTLMDEVLANDGTETNFLKLRKEIEYLKRTHGTQKEQIEILETQLANCQ